MNNYINTLEEKFSKDPWIGKSMGDIFMDHKEDILYLKQFNHLWSLDTYTDQRPIIQWALFLKDQGDEENIKKLNQLLTQSVKNQDYKDLAERTIDYLSWYYTQKIETLHNEEQDNKTEKSINRYQKALDMLPQEERIIQDKLGSNKPIDMTNIPVPWHAITPNIALSITGSWLNINDIVQYVESKEKDPTSPDDEILKNIKAERKNLRAAKQENIDQLKDSLND